MKDVWFKGTSNSVVTTKVRRLAAAADNLPTKCNKMEAGRGPLKKFVSISSFQTNLAN